MLQKIKDNPVKSITAVIGLISAILTVTFLIDDRYAHASDLNSLETEVKSLSKSYEEKTDAIFNYMKIQAITRKNILSLKQAEGKITPSEKVELDGITQQLNLLEE